MPFPIRSVRLSAGAALVAALVAASGVLAQASSTATGVSRLMNPAVSVNALFLGQVSADDDSPAANGVKLQEAEMQFTSVVDPFWTARMIVAYHPIHDPDGEHHGFETHIEEASLTARRMPAGLGLRIGKFFLPFGKHAPLHTHQWAFTAAPIGVTATLGDHGLTDTGAEVTASVPLSWYSDLKVYVVDGGFRHLFDAEDRDLAYGARWTNLWDVSDNGTLELGGSAIAGPLAPGRRQYVYGVDLTYKWSSGTRNFGPAINWTNELILPDPDGKTGDPLGIYSIFQYRFARNWWLGVGGSYARDALPVEGHEDVRPDPDGTVDYREARLDVTFAPSEFSDIRAEVSWLDTEQDGFEDLRFAVQWNFTIGAHPAHLY